MRCCYVIWFISLLLLPTACGSKNPNLALTVAPSETLTAAHEEEVRSIIESYYLLSGSLEALHDPSRLAEVATGPLLEALSEFAPPEPGTTFSVTRSVTIAETHVLEYTDTRVKAVGCGHLDSDRVTYDGEYIESLNRLSLMSVFVFAREDDTWKLFTMYPFSDPENDLRDWAYIGEEEKQMIGNLQDYIDLYGGCNLG